MALDRARIAATLDWFERRDLLSRREPEQVLSLTEPGFTFADAVARASSVHVHVKVDDINDLPHREIAAAGELERLKDPGYVKYRFPGGVNMIFSSFPVAQDDLIKGAVTLATPYVDHLGVDLRSEDEITRSVFEEVPKLAAAEGWRTTHQGGNGQPVMGAHTQVSEKYWAFAPEGPDGWRRPTEFAFGELLVSDDFVGCDHRPIDPAHPLAQQALDWEAMRRAALDRGSSGIVVFVKDDEQEEAANRLLDEVLGAPACCSPRAVRLSYDRPDEFPEVAVALFRLRGACPMPLTLVDGYPVASRSLPTVEEMRRYAREGADAPVPEVIG